MAACCTQTEDVSMGVLADGFPSKAAPQPAPAYDPGYRVIFQMKSGSVSPWTVLRRIEWHGVLKRPQIEYSRSRACPQLRSPKLSDLSQAHPAECRASSIPGPARCVTVPARMCPCPYTLPDTPGPLRLTHSLFNRSGF